MSIIADPVQQMLIQENVQLLPYNTFGLKASASHFCSVTSVKELKEAIEFGRSRSLSNFVLGGGSNVLFTKDIDALLLKIDMKGIELISETDNTYVVQFHAGESWHGCVMHCIENGYAGIENLSLIPGNIGAAPMQNIGAYGVEIKQRFKELEALNVETLEVETFNNTDCEFGYRESVFKRALKGKYIILKVTLELLKEPELNTSYGAIEQELEKLNVEEPTIQTVSQAVINIRRSKLPDPAEIGNAGSFFKNPVISIEDHERIKAEYSEMAAYPTDGKMKLAAGWLIEKAGWKGKRFDNYGVHERQALVLVNYGGAKGSDLYGLSEQIMKDVQEKFGVGLEREVNVI